MKRRLKKPVVYALSTVAFIALVATITYLGVNSIKETPNETLETGIFDSNENNTETKQVVNTEPTIIRPYLDKDVNIVKKFYDSKSDEKTQEESLTCGRMQRGMFNSLSKSSSHSKV